MDRDGNSLATGPRREDLFHLRNGPIGVEPLPIRFATRHEPAHLTDDSPGAVSRLEQPPDCRRDFINGRRRRFQRKEATFRIIRDRARTLVQLVRKTRGHLTDCRRAVRMSKLFHQFEMPRRGLLELTRALGDSVFQLQTRIPYVGDLSPDQGHGGPENPAPDCEQRNQDQAGGHEADRPQFLYAISCLLFTDSNDLLHVFEEVRLILEDDTGVTTSDIAVGDILARLLDQALGRRFQTGELRFNPLERIFDIGAVRSRR